MQGALERTEENQYHLYNVDGAGDEINELARVQIAPYMPKESYTAQMMLHQDAVSNCASHVLLLLILRRVSLVLTCCRVCVQVRAEKQREWEQKFTQHLQKREQTHADVSWLQSMPQHCVQESRAKTLLIGGGLLAAVLQLVAVYVILSLVLRIPIKGD